MRNLITDVPGIQVGHADDARLGSGATVVIFDEPAVASIDVRGGGPGTRETALLDPAQTVQGIDAIALAGGSAYGLDAASGVQAWLKEQNRGFVVRTTKVPIVPAAILFDLLSSGDKDWGRTALSGPRLCGGGRRRPRLCAGQRRRRHRRDDGELQRRHRLGFRAGRDGFTVGALAAANSTGGSVLVDDGPGSGRRCSNQTANSADEVCRKLSSNRRSSRWITGSSRENRTLVVVAPPTELRTKAQAKRLAVMAELGLSW